MMKYESAGTGRGTKERFMGKKNSHVNVTRAAGGRPNNFTKDQIHKPKY